MRPTQVRLTLGVRRIAIPRSSRQPATTSCLPYSSQNGMNCKTVDREVTTRRMVDVYSTSRYFTSSESATAPAERLPCQFYRNFTRARQGGSRCRRACRREGRCPACFDQTYCVDLPKAGKAITRTQDTIKRTLQALNWLDALRRLKHIVEEAESSKGTPKCNVGTSICSHR